MNQEEYLEALLTLRDRTELETTPEQSTPKQSMPEQRLADTDPEVARDLEVLNQVRADLNSMPALDAPDTVWRSIQSELDMIDVSEQSLTETLLSNGESDPSQAQAPGYTARWYSIAAGFFLVTALGLVISSDRWQGSFSPQIANSSSGERVSEPATIASSASSDSGVRDNRMIDLLILQSQNLERTMQSTAPGLYVNTSTRGALLQRITEIDGQLSELTYRNEGHSELAEKLWRQRVNVMQSMIAIENPGSAKRISL